MKTNLQLKLILFLALAMASTTNLVAQTYNSGTWYSTYSTTEQKTNDNGFTSGTNFNYTVFSPNTGKLSFEWKKSGWLVAYCKFTLEITDNTGKKVATISSDVAAKVDNYVPETKNVSTNITGLTFNQTSTLQGYHRNVKLPLAQHILLAEGTYGTADYTEPHDFGSAKWGETATAVDEIALRSFLSAGNITVSSSLPSVFRINSADNTSGITYTVGANACASSNGAAEQPCAEGVLGNISLYGFKIYFCPQEAKTYEGTITITDGVSTATVAVKGVGLKQDQTITFEPASPIYDNDNATIAPAETSSQLAPTYTFEPENIVSWTGEAFAITPLTDSVSVKITAAQTGNSNYNAATPATRTITILPSKTYGTELATVCAGETFNYDGKDYPAGEYKDIVLSAKNRFGSDSLVTLTVNELPTYLFPEAKTIYVGKDSIWRDKSLAEYTVGVHNLYDSLKTIADCDSVYQLTLTVVALPTTYGTESATVCAGESFLYYEQDYFAGVHENILLPIKNYLGGDTLVTLTVNEYEVTPDTTVYDTTFVGDELIVAERVYVFTEAKDTTIIDSTINVHGCDSVIYHEVNVAEKGAPTQLENATKVSSVTKFVQNGTMYIRRDNELFGILGNKID